VKRCKMPFETLADYVEGRADAQATARVRQHLDAGCRQCRESLSWLEKAMGAIRETESVQVPAASLERARALFRERFRPAPARSSWLARLSFDGRLAPLPAMARGVSDEGFQLVYSAEEYDVDIWQEPTEAGDWYLIGQVLPHVTESRAVPLEVILAGAAQTVFTVRPDGEEFHFTAVPAGVYRMRLRLADGEMVIPDLTVGR